jgi:transcriptional regulator with XRE-family HTH domain
MVNQNQISRRLRELREGRQLSLRALAQKAGVAVSFVSKIEAGRGSPTVATLLKLLEALGISAPEFFAAPAGDGREVLVFRQADMQALDDGDKSWHYLFPHRLDVRTVMTYEEYRPQTKHVEPERHPVDMCGFVIDGTLTLQPVGKPAVTVGTGESFYIRAGTRHTAANRGKELLRLVVTEVPHTRARRRHRRSG